MLEILNLQKTFNPGTVNSNTVFDGFSLTIKDGDFITVVGSNGAGKSTLLNLIAGSIMPDGGRILLNGKDITYLKENKRASYIGRVFQDPRMGTAGNMWIEENLALANRRGKRRTLRWGMAKKKEAEALKQSVASLNLGLEQMMHKKVGLLSGGQR